MLWTSFNELSNSSTRCEAGGARMAIQSDGPVLSGIDNQATVTMCNDITDHQRKSKDVRLMNEQGARIIGGDDVAPAQKIAEQKAMGSH